MIWNTVPNEDLLRMWKQLRTNLNTKDIEDRLIDIAAFTASMPFGARTIDYYTSENWPTPWEILFHRSFCTSSISVLIYYTLTMVDNTDVSLYLVDDKSDIYLIPVIAGQFVLNFYPGSVCKLSEIEDKIEILRVFDKSEIKPVA